MPTYEYHCESCQHTTDAFFSLQEERPTHIECDVCRENTAEYRISSPSITRASYIDGTKRFQQFREAAQLNKEAAASKSGERKKEIAREIRKMGVQITKD